MFTHIQSLEKIILARTMSFSNGLPTKPHVAGISRVVDGRMVFDALNVARVANRGLRPGVIFIAENAGVKYQ